MCEIVRFGTKGLVLLWTLYFVLIYHLISETADGENRFGHPCSELDKPVLPLQSSVLTTCLLRQGKLI